jgi:phospho-N-acetylmuramoyl-pentapeptide-transferase
MQSIFISFIVSCLVAVLAAPFVIAQLKRLKLGQYVRDDGPQTHLSKQGTPSMGGLIMAIGIIAAVLFAVPRSPDVYMALFVAAGFGFIGFLDDFMKVKNRRSLGLKGRYKIFGQLLFSAALALYVYMDRGGLLYVPILEISVDLGWMYVPFAMFIVIGAANGVNFADGVDGLCAGATSIAIGAYGLLAAFAGRFDLASLSSSIVGSCMAFLWYNAHPALVFMGDTGSLGLGGMLGAFAVLTGNELLLAIIGGVFVVEVISVVLQVYYIRKLKKRLFRMAPIHHHFELLGHPEGHVTVRFWIVAMMLAAIGLAIKVWG